MVVLVIMLTFLSLGANLHNLLSVKDEYKMVRLNFSIKYIFFLISRLFLSLITSLYQDSANSTPPIILIMIDTDLTYITFALIRR